MVKPTEQEWLKARVSLGAAAGWTAQEMRVVADLAYKLAQQGRNDEAITMFEGLAALAPATSYFQTALGALYLRKGELESAVQHFNEALTADPSDITALASRGEALYRLREFARARADFERVINSTVAQNDSSLQNYVVRARALLNQIQQA